MKKIIAIALFFVAFAANAQDQKKQVVEASCGQCNFGLKGKGGCDLAVKIDGQEVWSTPSLPGMSSIRGM